MAQNSIKPTIAYIALYAAVRLFSYFFQPNSVFNTVLTVAVLLVTCYLLLRNDERGWYIVAAEIILGGSGNFLHAFGLSLRTLLLGASILIWFYQHRRNLRQIYNQNKLIVCLLSALYCVVAISSGRAYYFGHNLKLILGDIVPYLFFLYYFPLKKLLQNNKYLISNIQYLLLAAIIGNFLFTFLTFTGFSTGIWALQGNYYHWFRDIANGKITDLGFNFYRIVLNEQLLLIPLLIFYLSKIIKKSQKIFQYYNIIIFALLATLAINLTRIYIVALIIGLLFLFTKTNWKRWLVYSLISCFLFLFSFTAIHLAASRGESLGWEIFGLRLQSIVSPELEDSSLSRMLLLPKILDKIKIHPLLGNGLGDTVTVFSPVLNQQITTSQFDWGYLEIWDELGLLGLATWLFLISYFLFQFYKKRNAISWLLPSFVSILIINITSPALFHVLGVTWLVALAAITTGASSEQSSWPLHTPEPTYSSTATDKQNSATMS